MTVPADSAPRAKRPPGRFENLYPILTWTGAAAVLAWSTWAIRGYVLDDAYIHLRYAANLVRNGSLQFNPGERSYGTSSIAFTLLVATVARITSPSFWGNLPKLLSTAAAWADLLLFLSLARLASRRAPAPSFGHLGLTAALLVSVPSTVRWLENGMETSLAIAAIFAACWAAGSLIARGPRIPPAAARVGTGVLVALPAIIRIDLLPITVGLAAILALGLRRGARDIVVTALVIAAAWFACLFAWTGLWMPDSAVGKELGHLVLTWPLVAAGQVAVASPLWAAGTLLLAWLACRHASPRAGVFLAFVGIAPLVAVVCAGTAVGQSLLGARYFLPHFAFAWGVSAILVVSPWFRPGSPTRIETTAAAGMLVIAATHALVLHRSLAPAVATVAVELPDDLRSQDKVIAAIDVGLIGWTSGARILDLGGLVNGHAMALARTRGRFCLGRSLEGAPDALVLQPWQAASLGSASRDAPIVSACPGLPTIFYVNTGRSVMRAHNVSGASDWILWRRAPG